MQAALTFPEQESLSKLMNAKSKEFVNQAILGAFDHRKERVPQEEWLQELASNLNTSPEETVKVFLIVCPTHSILPTRLSYTLFFVFSGMQSSPRPCKLW